MIDILLSTSPPEAPFCPVSFRLPIMPPSLSTVQLLPPFVPWQLPPLLVSWQLSPLVLFPYTYTTHPTPTTRRHQPAILFRNRRLAIVCLLHDVLDWNFHLGELIRIGSRCGWLFEALLSGVGS